MEVILSGADTVRCLSADERIWGPMKRRYEVGIGHDLQDLHVLHKTDISPLNPVVFLLFSPILFILKIPVKKLSLSSLTLRTKNAPAARGFGLDRRQRSWTWGGEESNSGFGWVALGEDSTRNLGQAPPVLFRRLQLSSAAPTLNVQFILQRACQKISSPIGLRASP